MSNIDGFVRGLMVFKQYGKISLDGEGSGISIQAHGEEDMTLEDAKTLEAIGWFINTDGCWSIDL